MGADVAGSAFVRALVRLPRPAKQALMVAGDAVLLAGAAAAAAFALRQSERRRTMRRP